MKPNAKEHYNPDPDYLRSLIDRAGLTQAKAAELVGVEARTMRRYLALQGSDSYKQAPYAIQYALEILALFSAQNSNSQTQK